MKILYTKSLLDREHELQIAAKVRFVVYFCPKKQIGQVRIPANCKVFAYEDIDKTNEPYTLANDNSVLILDNPSRYKIITTKTFKRLAKLAMQYRHKMMIDIVPFTSGVEYLYVPLAYMDRNILGYQHWYAYRENNFEIAPDGTKVRSHDFELLASKMAPHTTINYTEFFTNKLTFIDCELTANEREMYQLLRDSLFAEYNTYQPVITRLADYTNTTTSKYAALTQYLIDNDTGNTIVYTNIKSHNKAVKKLSSKAVTTYYEPNGAESEADTIILFEAPIVKSYLFLDVVARLKPTCKIIICRADTTADKLLCKKMSEEFGSVNEFTKTLRRACNGG